MWFVMTKEPLSRREREVVDLMSTGSTNLAMANSLGISVATIETHVKHIRQKLGIRGRQWIDAALDEKDKNTHSGY